MMIRKALIPDVLPAPRTTRDMIEITFTVAGKQIPQGSKLPQAIYDRNGRPVMKNGRAIVVCRDDNPNLQSWRGAIADAARRAYGQALMTGAIYMENHFWMPRPKGHFGTGRNANRLKDDAPQFMMQKPDDDKLTRAIADALTGVVWRDDSQICRRLISKSWGDCYRTEITIVSLDGLTEEPF